MDRVERREGLRLTAARIATGPLGWLMALIGVGLCVLGWYGVSGERFTARQVPYLASATVPGAALIVAGVVWAAVRARPGGAVGEPPATAPPAAGRPAEWEAPAPGGDARVLGGGLVAVPGGTLCHRPGCPLVAGKPQAVEVDAAAVRERGLAPCPVCEPDVLPGRGEPG